MSDPFVTSDGRLSKHALAASQPDATVEMVRGMTATQVLAMLRADDDEHYDVTDIVEPACGLLDLNDAIGDVRKGGDDLLHWTPSQRALLGARAVRSKHGGNRRGKRRDDGGRYMYVDREAHRMIANAVGVSVRQLRAALRLLRTEKTQPLIYAVGAGIISVHDALFAVDEITPETYGAAVIVVRAGEYRTMRALVADL